MTDDPFYAPLLHNTLSLTMLNSGQKSSIIPARAEAKLDIRLLSNESIKTALDSLRQTIQDGKVLVEAEETPVMPPATPTNSTFFRALVETIRTVGPLGVVAPYLTPGATVSPLFSPGGNEGLWFYAGAAQYPGTQPDSWS